MIYDNISNRALYEGLSDDIAAALEFLATAATDLAEGSYQILPGLKAGVQVYDTKVVNTHGYEAHQQFIDIQYLLQGEEVIRVRPLPSIEVTQPYDAERDVLFAADDAAAALNLPLGAGYFAILYPQDAHMPQLALSEPQPVKKVVVKVPVRTVAN